MTIGNFSAVCSSYLYHNTRAPKYTNEETRKTGSKQHTVFPVFLSSSCLGLCNPLNSYRTSSTTNVISKSSHEQGLIRKEPVSLQFSLGVLTWRISRPRKKKEEKERGQGSIPAGIEFG